MPDSFDDRFSGLPVDAPNAPLISDIVGNSQIASPQINLVPVDYDPFPKTVRKRGLEAFNEEPPTEMIRPDAPLADKAFGLNDKERYQFFPERLARSVYDVMSGQVAPYNPSTGEYNVEGALDVAGLMGGAPLGIKPGAASLGSGAVRPIMNANKNEAVPAFFSAVEKAVTDISQPKMTGQQWLGTLSNKPGVKPEELDWIGLKDYLKENADKVVTKQEIESHVAANKVELKEVNNADIKDPLVKYLYESFGPATKHIKTSQDIVDARKHNSAFRESTKGLSDEEVLKAARKSEEYEKVGDTKYSKYQLPGGENYREKLLMLSDDTERFNKLLSRMDELRRTPNGALSPEYKALEQQTATYKSSHWNELNVLAHVRMNDRTMNGEGVAVRNKISGNTSQVFPNDEAAKAYAAKNFPESYHSKFEYVPANRPVKSLHIEEIQSDWHQQGRDKGYKLPAEEAKKLEARRLELENLGGQLRHEGKEIPEEIKTEWAGIMNKLQPDNTVRVPDAPFKKTWHELALKRMLREAAEKGYDRLSWTPGEAQAARYDLSKQVDKVNLVPVDTVHSGDKIKFRIDAFKDNKKLIEHYAKDENEIASIIGKEAAKKLLESRNQHGAATLVGQELKVGGEGMKGFYDQIIPKALEKIGKEHGVKVKTGNLPYPKLSNKIGEKPIEQSVHYIDIPQSLKNQAMHKGFPLFSGGFMLNPVDHDPWENKK